MKVKAYHFKPASRLPRKRAAEIGRYLGRLSERNQRRLTPEIVVADARHRGSPLHSLFEWDDTAAAEAYRLWQARHLLKSVTVVYRDVTPKRSTYPIRAFVNVKSVEEDTDDDRIYISTARGMKDEQYREQIIAQALREAETWRSRYLLYHELAEICEAIEHTKQKHAKRATA